MLPRKRDQCRGTVQHHLREWAAPVYRSFVLPERSDSAVKYVSEHDGEHFRVADGRGPHVIVSTVPATKDAVLLTAGQAAAMLSAVLGGIVSVPASAHKPFTSSRRWALLDDPKRDKPSDYLRVSLVEASLQEAAEILDGNGASWNPFTNGQHRRVQGIGFDEAGLDMKHTTMEFSSGTIAPAAHRLHRLLARHDGTRKG